MPPTMMTNAMATASWMPMSTLRIRRPRAVRPKLPFSTKAGWNEVA